MDTHLTLLSKNKGLELELVLRTFAPVVQSYLILELSFNMYPKPNK